MSELSKLLLFNPFVYRLWSFANKKCVKKLQISNKMYIFALNKCTITI